MLNTALVQDRFRLDPPSLVVPGNTPDPADIAPGSPVVLVTKLRFKVELLPRTGLLVPSWLVGLNTEKSISLDQLDHLDF